MRVRRAVPDDADAIGEIHVRTWQAAYGHVFPAERLASLPAGQRSRWWREVLQQAREGYAAHVAEDDGRVVGFVSIGPATDDSAEGELYAIYVLPESWGGGAGPALMDAGLESLRAAGYRDALLWVLDDNPRARRFYERSGWRSDGGEKRERMLETDIREVRYRIELARDTSP